MQKQKRKPGESYHMILPPSASLIPCSLLPYLPPPLPPPPPLSFPFPLLLLFYQPTSFADPRDDELKKREEVCLSCPHTASVRACVCQYLDERGHEIDVGFITGMLVLYMFVCALLYDMHCPPIWNTNSSKSRISVKLSVAGHRGCGQFFCHC